MAAGGVIVDDGYDQDFFGSVLCCNCFDLTAHGGGRASDESASLGSSLPAYKILRFGDRWDGYGLAPEQMKQHHAHAGGEAQGFVVSVCTDR